jgi:signal transduction histidine kinase
VKVFPSTVRWRVTAAATAAIVVVLVAVGWGLVVNHRRELTSSLDERMSEIADGIVDDLRAGRPPDIIVIGEDDWLAQIVDEDGVVVSASSAIAGDAALGGAVDGQRIRGTGPLPGGDDDDMRVLSRTVDTAGGPTTIHIAAPRDDISDSVDTLRQSLLVAVPLAAGVLALLTWVIVGRTLRPVEQMRTEVAAIEGADLHRRVAVPSADDEIGRLARTMNDMLARVEQAQARQRRFVADASHELRGPLTRMRTELEVDLQHPTTADPAMTQRSVLEEVIGLQQLVDDLLLLARSDTQPNSVAGATRFAIGDVVAGAVRRTRRLDGPTVDVTIASPALVRGRAGELDRAIGNLLDNAVRYAAATVRVRVDSGDGSVSVVVEDDGPGISAVDAERVFERFARLDAARSADDGGAGLGLSIARDIVERHGGTLVVDTGYERGARLVITLPPAD